MARKSLLILFTLMLVSIMPTSTCAQESAIEAEEAHHHHGNEFSVAVGIVPLPAEDEVAVGFHLHYIRGLGKNNRFGLGAALEAILDEHRHYTLSVVFQCRPYKGIVLAYAPGILMKRQGEIDLFQFAQHVEVAYEFEIGIMHLGPVAEIGFEAEGVHYMAGVHMGVDF